MQETRYPWDGAVKMTVTPEQARDVRGQRPHPRLGAQRAGAERPLSLHRQGRRAADDRRSTAQPVPHDARQGLRRRSIARGSAGDTIELDLPMPVRRVVAQRAGRADRGRVALQRGPIVYAAEWPDNPNGKVRNIVLPDANALTTEFRADLLNGVQVIKGRARRPRARREAAASPQTEQPFMAIPYATWANRGRGQMAVWLARTEPPRGRRRSRRSPPPRTITASPLPNGRGKNPRNIDRRRGAAQLVADSVRRTSTGGRCSGSSSEWVEMTFAKPATVSRSRGLLVRRHRPRRRARAGIVAAALQGRRTTGSRSKAAERYGVARDAWNTRDVQAGHDAAPAHRADDAARRSRPGCRSGR